MLGKIGYVLGLFNELLKNKATPRIVLFTLAGIFTSFAAAVPPLAIIVLPIVGQVTITKLLGAAGVYLAGWATRTVGDVPLAKIIPEIREKIETGEYKMLKESEK